MNLTEDFAPTINWKSSLRETKLKAKLRRKISNRLWVRRSQSSRPEQNLHKTVTELRKQFTEQNQQQPSSSANSSNQGNFELALDKHKKEIEDKLRTEVTAILNQHDKEREEWLNTIVKEKETKHKKELEQHTLALAVFSTDFTRNQINKGIENYRAGGSKIERPGKRPRASSNESESVHELDRYILETDIQTQKLFVDKGKIVFGLSSCHVYEYNNLISCKHCQRLGHFARNCTFEKVCRRCGESQKIIA